MLNEKQRRVPKYEKGKMREANKKKQKS